MFCREVRGKGDVCLLERVGRVPLVEVRACACVLL